MAPLHIDADSNKKIGGQKQGIPVISQVTPM